MNEIVVMHNDLTDLPLKRFNASEIDILHTICYEVKNKETDEVTLDFDKIRQLSHYQNKNQEQLVESISQTNKKLLQLNFNLTSEDGMKIVQFALFPTFVIDKEAETLKVKVNEPFVYLLNNLSGNYTAFELQQSAELRSIYSKQIYKKLQEFKYTGIWAVSVVKFKDYLDIPKGFSISKIDERIIKPAIEELKDIFIGLKCEKTYKKSASGKGRPSVVGYEWRFTAFTKDNNTCEPTQEGIAEVTGWDKAHRFCPKCHRPIYKKYLENENGGYYLYGHTDFVTGQCDFTSYDLADLLQEYQLPKSDEPDTPEQVKAKNFIAEMINKIFKK